MAKSQFIRSGAVIEVADVVASAAFYTDKLGFDCAGLWGEPPCFCIVDRGGVRIFLDQSREKRAAPVNQYWAAYVYVEDVTAYANELRERGVDIIRSDDRTFYGCREVDIRDPDGHIICFGQDLDPLDLDPLDLNPPVNGPGL